MSGKRNTYVRRALLIMTLLVFVIGTACPVLAVTRTTAYPVDFILHAKTKKSTKGKNVSIPYKSKVIVYGKITKRTKAAWVKLKYKGNICYKYFRPKTIYFTKKGFNYNDYKNLNVGEIRQKAVTEAVNIFRYKKTVYKNTKNITPGKKDKKGRMQFDCSGFTSYIANKVMTKYVPNYNISKGIKAQRTANALYTDANGTFMAKTVCKKKPDFTKLKPGDFLFFSDKGKKKGTVADHVGIYIGNKEFIHCTPSVNGVRIMPLNRGRYKERFLYAKTFLPNDVPKPMDKPMTVKSPYTTGSNVYKDIKFNNKNGDKVYTGDIVTVKYITPCTWSKNDESCCLIEYYKDNTKKTGYFKKSLLDSLE